MTYSFYGIIRKIIKVNAIEGFYIEVIFMLPIALTYFTLNLETSLNVIINDNLIILSGLVTSIPLICMGYAIKMIDYTTLSALQYIGPTVIFFVAIFIFDEPISINDIIVFSGIWFGIMLFLFDSYKKSILRICK